MNAVGNFQLEGHRYSKAWATNQKIHFATKANLPFTIEKSAQPNSWVLDFGEVDETVVFHVALSGCDVAGANKNIKAESKPFDETRKKAIDSWNKELNKTQVYGGTEDQRAVFATAFHNRYKGSCPFGFWLR